MANEQHSRLIDLLVRIPLFDNLVPDECRRILAACKQVKFAVGDVIFKVGDPGTRLMILLQGNVSIQLANEKEIAQLEAIDTIGEMEIASNQSRYARAVALTPVSGLVITQHDLDGLFDQYPELGVKVLRNIVNALAKKLAKTNLKV